MLLTLLTDEEKNFPGFKADYSQVPLSHAGTGTRLTLPAPPSVCPLTHAVPPSRLRGSSARRPRLLLLALLSRQLPSADVLCVGHPGEPAAVSRARCSCLLLRCYYQSRSVIACPSRRRRISW